MLRAARRARARAADRVVGAELRRVSDGQRHGRGSRSASTATPARIAAVRASDRQALDAAERARARPRHRGARRHRLGRRDPHRARGAREPVARRADRHGGEPALRRRGDDGDADLRAPVRVAELDLHPAERRRRSGRAEGLRQRRARPQFDFKRVCKPRRVRQSGVTAVSAVSEVTTRASTTAQKIPNNVNLAERPARCSARSSTGSRTSSTGGSEMGPGGLAGATTSTCAPPIGVEPDGWAHFDYVKMPDYRWGIFLAPAGCRTRRSTSASTRASRRGRTCPASIARTCAGIIVTQGDTEPASVEQQRHLGCTAPVAVRPAQPVPGQRRGRPPPVGDGVPAAHATSAATAARRPKRCCSSAARATPTTRASSARSTSRTPDWLVVLHVHVLHRPRRQVPAVRARRDRASIRSRARRKFMLTEEAHHMFVGESGVSRVDPAHLRGR